MKKIFYLILLVFPIIILGIVNMSSAVIARTIPIPVERVEIALEQKEITGTVGGSVRLNVTVYPSGAKNKLLHFSSSDTDVATVDQDGTVHFEQYGYAVITVRSDDGNYTDECDVMLADPGDNPADVKAVVASYREDLHSSYRFGAGNAVAVTYKVFPKTAVNPVSFACDGGTVSDIGSGAFTVAFGGTGEHVLRAATRNSDGSETSFELYTFRVYEGMNAVADTPFSEFSGWLSAGTNVYLLSDYKIASPVVCSGCTLYGNGWKLDHSGLPHYTDESLDGNVKAVTLGENAVLDSVRVVGAVDENRLVYNRVHNVGLLGNNAAVRNCTIENGKYNISTYGDPIGGTSGQNLAVDNTRMIGAAVACIQVNCGRAYGYKQVGVTLSVRDLYFDISIVGILVENNALDDENVRGRSVVNVLPSAKGGEYTLVSNNWRNLDEGYSAAESMGLEYIIDEVRGMEEIVYKDEYNDYFVNCVILKMGGASNYSEVIFDGGAENLNECFAYVERKPNALEGMQLGGRWPFEVWCLKSSYYGRIG